MSVYSIFPFFQNCLFIFCLSILYFFFTINASVSLLYSPTRLAKVYSARVLSVHLLGVMCTNFVRSFTLFSLDVPALGSWWLLRPQWLQTNFGSALHEVAKSGVCS